MGAYVSTRISRGCVKVSQMPLPALMEALHTIKGEKCLFDITTGCVMSALMLGCRVVIRYHVMPPVFFVCIRHNTPILHFDDVARSCVSQVDLSLLACRYTPTFFANIKGKGRTDHKRQLLRNLKKCGISRGITSFIAFSVSRMLQLVVAVATMLIAREKHF